MKKLNNNNDNNNLEWRWKKIGCISQTQRQKNM